MLLGFKLNYGLSLACKGGDVLRGSLPSLDGIVSGCIVSVAGMPKSQERISCEHVHFGAGMEMARGVVARCASTGRMSNVEWGEAYCTFVSFPKLLAE
jgi:hypothetical protein